MEETLLVRKTNPGDIKMKNTVCPLSAIELVETVALSSSKNSFVGKG